VYALGKRASVSCNMLCEEVKGRNCLGKAARDFGHNRLPLPPARTTGIIYIV